MPVLSSFHARLMVESLWLTDSLSAEHSVNTSGSLTIPALALGFLVTAVIAYVAKPRDALTRRFAFLVLACAVVVAAYPAFASGNLAGRALEASADGLGVALFVRFCFAFPVHKADAPFPERPLWRVLVTFGTAMPVAGALLNMASQTAQGWPRTVGRMGFSLGLAVGIVLGLAILARTYVYQSRPDVRGPIVVVWVGAALSFVPLLAFNVVPGLLMHASVVPFSRTQYTLIVLPLAVGFASIRWRKVSMLALIDRVSVYLILALLLLGCYAGLVVAVTQVAGEQISSVSGLITLALAILAATTFAPLRATIQRFIDTALYHDHYNLVQTVQRLSRSLALVRDRDVLARSLLTDLAYALNLQGAALVILPGGLDPDLLRMIEPDDLYVCRAYASASARAELARQLARLDIAAVAAPDQPLALEVFPGCAALGRIGSGSPEAAIALLILGCKRGGGSLRSEDLTLLTTVLPHCATAFENAALIGGLHTTLAQLRRSTDQLEIARAETQLLVRALVTAEERQRADLARELHDDALQDLIYVSRHSQYCAAQCITLASEGTLHAPSFGRLQRELEQLAQTASASEHKLRDLCAGLYPPLLESLGLLAALESLTEDLGAASHVTIRSEWDAQVEEGAKLLDAETRLHLYRIVQEALRNASRHAGAKAIVLRIAVTHDDHRVDNSGGLAFPAQLVCSIADDGTGLSLPVDYVALLRKGHLGLASMRERTERIGGELTFSRGALGGTHIQLRVPLPEPPYAVPVPEGGHSNRLHGDHGVARAGAVLPSAAVLPRQEDDSLSEADSR